MKRTQLKRKTPLKAHKALRSKAGLKSRSRLKNRQKKARKRKEAYFSIFTGDMHTCYITGSTNDVEPHHIFGASRKELSEKYGFMLPLRRDWHRDTEYSIHMDRKFSVAMKMRCQEYYLRVLGKTEEDWQKEFSKWWTKEDIGKTGGSGDKGRDRGSMAAGLFF